MKCRECDMHLYWFRDFQDPRGLGWSEALGVCHACFLFGLFGGNLGADGPGRVSEIYEITPDNKPKES